MVSGLAPGRLAVTWMVGKSTFGRSLTGRSLYAAIPKTRMDIMTSVVMIGRRIKSSGMFMIYLASSLFFDFYLGAGDKPELTVGNDFFTGLQSLFNDCFTVKGSAHNYRAGFNREIVLYDKYILTLLACLNSLRRNHNGIGLCGQRHDCINKLTRPEPPLPYWQRSPFSLIVPVAGSTVLSTKVSTPCFRISIFL